LHCNECNAEDLYMRDLVEQALDDMERKEKEDKDRN
jgi:hypothetical protein